MRDCSARDRPDLLRIHESQSKRVKTHEKTQKIFTHLHRSVGWLGESATGSTANLSPRVTVNACTGLSTGHPKGAFIPIFP